MNFSTDMWRHNSHFENFSADENYVVSSPRFKYTHTHIQFEMIPAPTSPLSKAFLTI